MKRTIIGKAITASVLLGLSAGSMLAEQQFEFTYGMPVTVQATINEEGCENSPGPVITLSGEIILGGLKAQLVFQNNVKGTQQTTVTYSSALALMLPGGAITIPKQPVLGGVGGNPWIYMQYVDGNGAALGEEVLLGRCVQGLKVTGDLVNQATASTTVAATCRNNPGPKIYFGGTVALSGLKARLIFRNNDKGTHTNDDHVVDVELIQNGMPVVIPKQPPLGGSGGNPLIWLKFLQGDNRPIGDPIFLGRCNQI